MRVYEFLRKIPVAINNYYGDPVLQWTNTVSKVKTLADDGHQGPVGIITKGLITPSMAKELRQTAQDLNLVVLVSISGFSKEIEPIGQSHRYKTIKNLIRAGIPVIGYVRPITPPYNSDEETLEEIFKNTAGAGCENIVVSGFRGDDAIVNSMQPDEKQEWTLRVKLMSPELGQICRRLAGQYGLQMFTRTSCGVAVALGLNRSFNPYYNSPRGAGCGYCPIKDTCGHIEPDTGAMEFVRSLGYDIEYVPNPGQICAVDPANRLSCLSCCTSCFVLKKAPHIIVKNRNIRLGDIAFIRFITGVLVCQEGVIDGGQKDVGHVKFPAFKMPACEVHCINTWYVWAHQRAKCFNCRYCITTVYELEEREYGCSPKMLAEYIEQERVDERCSRDRDVQLAASIAW